MFILSPLLLRNTVLVHIILYCNDRVLSKFGSVKFSKPCAILFVQFCSYRRLCGLKI